MNAGSAATDGDGAKTAHLAEDLKTKRLLKLFDACDADDDGFVSQGDVEATLRRLAGKHAGGRAYFAAADKDGDGLLSSTEFLAVFGQLPVKQHDLSTAKNAPTYLERHSLQPVLGRMVQDLCRDEPPDPYDWMIEFLAAAREASQQTDHTGDDGNRGEPKVSAQLQSEGVPLGGSPPPHQLARAEKTGTVSVNIAAVLRKTPKKLLQHVLECLGWSAVENLMDSKSLVHFTWDSKSFLLSLGHPAFTPPDNASPRLLPEAAWANRVPGMGHLCDKVNMALSLRLLQRLWPEKFRFWPRSWLLPAEAEKLASWLAKRRDETVIVKPADGSLGEGIFLVQSPSDLSAKLMAKPNWGASFGALAQRYVAQPALVDGLKFDLRLYVCVLCTDPLEAYLCKEGLARFCTQKYEAPTAANTAQHYMHLTNFSVNKKSQGFMKASDIFNVESKASKRPLSTLLQQIRMQAARDGHTFDEAKFFKDCEEVVVVLLQSLAPVLNVTYSRVAKECFRADQQRRMRVRSQRQAAKAKKKKGKNDSSDDEDVDGDEDNGCDDDDEEECPYCPKCFQLLGVDVLLDKKMQPWLLEMNGRPSMDIEEPVRLSEAPAGSRRCVCRDMDGEDHTHLPSEVDLYVKQLAMGGAFQLVQANGTVIPDSYLKLDFGAFGPVEDLQGVLQQIAELYIEAGGRDKAFTTYGLRRALKGAIEKGLKPNDVDSVVVKWRHQGYRHGDELEKDQAEIGVLDFAALLQDVANVWKRREIDAAGDGEEDELDELEALTDLLDAL